MKILYVIDSYFEPNAGGRDINIHTVANYMVEKGHEVTVLTAKKPEKTDFKYNVIWPKSKSATLVRSKKLLEILKGDYDIVSLHDAGGFSFSSKSRISLLSLLFKFKKRPYVYTLHMPEEIHPNWYKMVKTMMMAQCVIFVDHFMLKYANDIKFKRNIYIPSPINKNIISKMINNESFKNNIKGNAELLVTTLSRIDLKHKNVDFILDVAEKLADIQDIKFMIIGGGEGEIALKEYITEKKINNVICTGEMPNEEVNKYLDLADVMINTSTWPGTGRSVIEAMALGKIVFRRCTDGDDPVLKDGHNFIKYDDDDDLADKLKVIKNDKNNFINIANNAISTAEENYSIDTVGKNIENIYTKAIESWGE
jgi:glycosyltransferase involved in cell wall biosynthesis